MQHQINHRKYRREVYNEPVWSQTGCRTLKIVLSVGSCKTRACNQTKAANFFLQIFTNARLDVLTEHLESG